METGGKAVIAGGTAEKHTAMLSLISSDVKTRRKKSIWRMKPYLQTPPDRLRLTARCQQAINVSGEDCFFFFYIFFAAKWGFK